MDDKKNKSKKPVMPVFLILAGFYCLILSMIFSKIFGSDTAIWDNTFRSSSMFLSFWIFISSLYFIPRRRTALLSLVIQSLLMTLFLARLSRWAYFPALVRASLAALKWDFLLHRNPLVIFSTFFLFFEAMVPLFTLVIWK